MMMPFVSVQRSLTEDYKFAELALKGARFSTFQFGKNIQVAIEDIKQKQW
jgi:hypothetical protein